MLLKKTWRNAGTRKCSHAVFQTNTSILKGKAQQRHEQLWEAQVQGLPDSCCQSKMQTQNWDPESHWSEPSGSHNVEPGIATSGPPGKFVTSASSEVVRRTPEITLSVPTCSTSQRRDRVRGRPMVGMCLDYMPDNLLFKPTELPKRSGCQVRLTPIRDVIQIQLP